MAIKPLWIVSIALILALAALAAEHQRAERYKEQVSALVANVKGMGETLVSKDAVISEFEAASQEAQELINKQKKSLDTAAKRVQNLRSELAETRRQLQALEEADYAIPECEALLNLDLRVCPGHATSVLERAYRGLQGPDSAGTPTGVGADRAAPSD